MLASPQRLSAIDRLLTSVFLELPASASLPPLLNSSESLPSFLSLPLNASCTDGPVVQASIPAFRTVLLLIGFRILALEGASCPELAGRMPACFAVLARPSKGASPL